jgi:branched-chain amino acid transport system ATP-binding protein
MHPTARSILHFLGFFALLTVLYFISQKLDIPHGQPGAILGAYGHELLLDIGISITLAVSLNLILGIAGQFSLGHAGFLAAGAYTAALISGKAFPQLLPFFTTSPLHLSTTAAFTCIMLLASLAGMLVAALLGLLVGLPTLRLRGDYLAIATLGFGEILAVIFQNASYNDTPLFGGSTGLSLSSMRYEWVGNQANPDAPLPTAVQAYMDNVTYFVGSFAVFALALVTIYIVHNIKYATSGRALLAIREDTIASESVGVPSTRYKVAAFVIGAALAGFAGGLVAHHKSLINPESFRFMRSIEIVAMVILGGQGSITGSILAAIALTLLPELLRSYIPPAIMAPNTIEKWRMVIYSLFIILAMLFRPQGLFGRYELPDLLRWVGRRGTKALRHKGTKGKNNEREQKYSNVSGFGGVGAGDGTDARTLSFNASDAGGGAVRPDQPNETSSGLDSLEHRRGLRPSESGGLHSIPQNLSGISGGIGDPSGTRDQHENDAAHTKTGIPSQGDRSHSPVPDHEPRTEEREVTEKALRHKGTKALREEEGTTTNAPAPLSALVPQCLSASPPVPLLSATNLTMQFGGLKAVDTFSLSLLPGELVGLIGPNGAGKTTVFNMLTGVYRPTAGTIQIAGKSSLGLKPHAISKRGIARTFQNIRLFKNLSVLENVKIAQHAHQKQGIPSAILRRPAFYREEAAGTKTALAFLDLFHLAHLAQEQANSLSYGDQRRLEIARALATRPKILMLDEPAAGMNPTEKRELMTTIQNLRSRFQLTILLIEHDMKLVMGICERLIVLDYGKTIATGTPAEIRQNPAVITAYLGASAKQS